MPVISIDQLPEVKGVVPTTLAVQIKEREWFECYSSYLQAFHVTARMLRFIARSCRKTFMTENTCLEENWIIRWYFSQQIHLGVLVRELSLGRAVLSISFISTSPFVYWRSGHCTCWWSFKQLRALCWSETFNTTFKSLAFINLNSPILAPRHRTQWPMNCFVISMLQILDSLHSYTDSNHD